MVVVPAIEVPELYLSGLRVCQALTQLALRSVRAERFSPADLRSRRVTHRATVAESVGVQGRVMRRPQKLLTTKGFHRIDRCGPAGGDEAGDRSCSE